MTGGREPQGLESPAPRAQPQEPLTQPSPRSLHAVVAASGTVWLACLLAGIAAVIGAAALVGWAAGIRLLTTGLPDLPPIKINAAVSLVLLGTATIAILQAGGRGRIAAYLAAVAVLLLSLATLFEHVTGVSLGIDRLLEINSFDAGSPLPGRMAFQTTLAFACAAAALLALGRPLGRHHPAQLLAGVCAVVGGMSVLGYLYGAEQLTHLAYDTSIALPTALALLVLGAALVYADPEHGFVRLILDDGVAGQVSRRILPAALLIVPIGGWVRLQAQNAGLFDQAMGVVVMASFEALLLLLVLAWTATRVYRLEAERAEARLDIDRFFELATDLVCIADESGRLVVASPSWERTLGYPVEEITSRPFLDYVHPDDRERTIHEFSREVGQGKSTSAFQNRYLCADGEYRWLEWNSMPDAPSRRVYAVARDVTERKQWEAGLARLATIVESSIDGVYATDLDDRLTEWNPACERIFGLTRDEVLGRSVSITAPETEHADQQRRYKRAKAGVPQTYEAPRLRKDGGRFRAQLSTFPMYGEEGSIVGLSTLVRDVTEAYEASERLRVYADQLREQAGLLDLAHDAIFVRDLESHITYWNPGAEQTYGWTAEEAIGQVTHTLLHTVFPESLEALDRALVATGEWEGRLVHTARDGRILVVESRQALERDAAGKPQAILEINRDVTETVAAQRSLEEYAAELARSNAELEQFAYVASHDLQEPLRMVTGFAGLLQKRYQGKLGAEADEFIGYAIEGAHRMQDLINDLLAYSRVGTRGHELLPMDLDDALQTALLNLRVTIEEAGARVDCGELPTVRADRQQMIQLFQNLVGNAIKFRGTEPPVVSIGARRDGRTWRISVRDNGIGIAPEHSEQIFVIFRRLHSRESYPGSGIGLAICKKIVERHGGRIWVDSKPGQGATFSFTLPDRERSEIGRES